MCIRDRGIALSIGSVILVLWIVALTLCENTYLMYSNLINNWFGKLIIFGFTFALFYHLSNGIRHLFCDAGYGYDLNHAYISGVAVIISSLLLTSITWVIIYFKIV